MNLYVLGGTITYHPSGWQMDYGDKEDEHGVTGNILRVMGAYYEWRYGYNKHLILVGGKGFYEGMNSPHIAQMMWKDLHSMGIPSGDMEMVNEGNTTLDQLKQVCSRYEPIEHIVMSNEWHLPRIELLTRANGLTVKLRSAEDTILRYAPHWQQIIDHYNTKLNLRLDSELRGIYACLCGNYQ